MTEVETAPSSAVLGSVKASASETRAVWNGMFDRRPAAILRPTGTADVIRAVGLARASGVPFAVRSGGHSVAGLLLL